MTVFGSTIAIVPHEVPVANETAHEMRKRRIGKRNGGMELLKRETSTCAVPRSDVTPPIAQARKRMASASEMPLAARRLAPAISRQLRIRCPSMSPAAASQVMIEP